MKRLSRGGGSPFAREVVRSASGDAPSLESRERTIASLRLAGAIAAATGATAATAAGPTAAVGHAAGVSGTASVTGSLSGSAALGWTPLVGKVVSLVLLAGGLGGAALVVHAGSPMISRTSNSVAARPVASASDISPVVSPLPAAAPAATASTPQRPLPQVSLPQAHPPALPAVATAGAPPHTSAGSPQNLVEAMGVLERVRTAVAADDAPGALAMLADYETRFPGGALAPEASVLRIEALVSARREAEARSEAERFLAASPDSPHARHVRAIIAAMTRP